MKKMLNQIVLVGRMVEDVKIIDSLGKEKIIPKDGVIPIINNLTIEFNNEVKAIIKK